MTEQKCTDHIANLVLSGSFSPEGIEARRELHAAINRGAFFEDKWERLRMWIDAKERRAHEGDCGDRQEKQAHADYWYVQHVMCLIRGGLEPPDPNSGPKTMAEAKAGRDA